MKGHISRLLEALLVAGHANPGSNVLHIQEGVSMTHNIKVRVNPDTESVVKVCQVRLRDRLSRRIFGHSQRYAVLIPGSTVDEVSIIENRDDDLMALADALDGRVGGDAR